MEGEWTEEAINGHIDAVGGECSKHSVGKSGDVLIVGDFLNHTTAGVKCESKGFNLFGNTYYGNGLIIGGESESPQITAEEVLGSIAYVERADSGGTVEI